MKTYPLVSLVTVNYNGCKHTIDLLESVQKLTYPNIEIIVVDNHSKEPIEPVQQQFPWVKLICLQENLGFAGGNNIGIRASKGEYIYLINNDTVLPAKSIEPLLKRALNNPLTGIVCPKILYYDDPSMIQFAGYTPIHPVTVRNSGIGYQEKDEGQYEHAAITALAHGAAMFIPRKVMEKAGLMAEQFFLYYEEIDYCERIKRAGYEIWFEPASQILHKESMSVGRESVLKAYYMSRNRLLYLRRNVNYPLFFLSLLYYLLIAAPKNIMLYLFRRQIPHLKAYLKGLFWNFTHFRGIHDNPVLTD